jgi:hypothetical protein
LVAFSMLMAVANVACLLEMLIRRRHCSLISVVGGVAGLAGFMIVPVASMNK